MSFVKQCQDEFITHCAAQRCARACSCANFLLFNLRGCSISLLHSHWHYTDIVHCLLFDYLLLSLFFLFIFRLYTARDRRRVNAVCVWSCSVRLYLPQSAEPQRDVHVAQLPRLLPAKHRVSLSVLRHGQRTSAHRVSTLWRRGHDKVGSREPIETGESPSTGRPAGVSIASIINVRQSASGALTNVV